MVGTAPLDRSDVGLLAARATAETVLVAGIRRSRTEDVERTLRLLRSAGVPLTGVVVTNPPRRDRDGGPAPVVEGQPPAVEEQRPAADDAGRHGEVPAAGPSADSTAALPLAAARRDDEVLPVDQASRPAPPSGASTSERAARG